MQLPSRETRKTNIKHFVTEENVDHTFFHKKSSDDIKNFFGNMQMSIPKLFNLITKDKLRTNTTKNKRQKTSELTTKMESLSDDKIPHFEKKIENGNKTYTTKFQFVGKTRPSCGNKLKLGFFKKMRLTPAQRQEYLLNDEEKENPINMYLATFESTSTASFRHSFGTEYET
jgi:hypothetical protein